MSAFGTKKPTGDIGVALTYPLEFQKAYALKNAGFRTAFYPTDAGMPLDLMVGDHFQAEYHQQKRLEANQSVMNRLQANKSAERKLLTGPHNYHLPPPVRSQRIYANPSYGAETYSSTRRDNGAQAPFRTVEVGREGAGLVGGVRTFEGQQFYKKQLDRRIAQLNKINAVAQGYAVQIGQTVKTDDNTKTGSVDKVRFFQYLRALLDAVVEGELGNFAFSDLKELIELLFHFGPTMTQEDIDDARDGLDSLLYTVRNGLSADPEAAQIPAKRAYAETLEVMTQKMREYIAAMESNQYMSEKEKSTLSKSLRKSLGFEKLLRKGNPQAALNDIAAVNPRARQVDEDIDAPDPLAEGRFDRPARPREDDEAEGMPRAPFAGRADDPARRRHGERHGAIIYGGPRYFGEDAEGEFYGMDAYVDRYPRYVAPLDVAGADPDAEGAVPPRPDQIAEVLIEVIKQVLRPLDGFNEHDIETWDDFITANYPVISNFTDEVARGMTDRGFAPADIAAGMDRIDDLGLFTLFQDYIRENAGAARPAAAAAAPRRGFPPVGGFPYPVYRDEDEDGLPDVIPGAEIPAGEAGAPPRAAPAGGEFPTDEERRQLAEEYDLPLSRAEFYDRFRTTAQIRELALRLPAELGGPYRMGVNTKLRNAKQAMNIRFKTAFDPDW